jgi:ADP-heptose:LPS heptosyltransferase
MNAAMASVNPDIDAVITPPYEPGFDSRAALLFGMSLAGGYDLAILPRWTEDWHHGGVVAEASGARWRLSYSAESTPYKKENFPQHDYFFTHVMDETAPAHEVWRGMAFLHALRMPMPATADIRQNFVCTDDDRASLLAFAPPDLPRPWIALGVGASGDFKRWPAARFAELTLALHLGMQGTVFVMGAGPADIQSAGEILALCPQGTVSLVGQMTPRQSGALVAACDVMVCNDSFPCHLAASVGTPVVLPVGHPADGNPATEYLPGRFGPWGVPFAWVQPATCDGAQFPAEDFMQDPKCIGDIPAAAIYNAVAEVLTRWKKEP